MKEERTHRDELVETRGPSKEVGQAVGGGHFASQHLLSLAVIKRVDTTDVCNRDGRRGRRATGQAASRVRQQDLGDLLQSEERGGMRSRLDLVMDDLLQLLSEGLRFQDLGDARAVVHLFQVLLHLGRTSQLTHVFWVVRVWERKDRMRREGDEAGERLTKLTYLLDVLVTTVHS